MNRIALVEDHERLAELVRTARAAAGIEADCFDRLEPAWHAVKQMPYGMLVVDRGLPDGDGLRLVPRLRKKMQVIDSRRQIVNIRALGHALREATLAP